MYTGYIYRYLISRTRHPSLAEDLTSETFLRALRSIDSVRYLGSDVGAWLTTIARNLLFDHMKSSSRREVTVATLTDAVSYDTPENLALREDELDRLRTCLANLTNDQRRCLELRYWLDRSLAETVTELQRDVNAVKALQHRAVQKLVALFDETS